MVTSAKSTRREFLKSSGLTAAGLALAGPRGSLGSEPEAPGVAVHDFGRGGRRNAEPARAHQLDLEAVDGLFLHHRVIAASLECRPVKREPETSLRSSFPSRTASAQDLPVQGSRAIGRMYPEDVMASDFLQPSDSPTSWNTSRYAAAVTIVPNRTPTRAKTQAEQFPGLPLLTGDGRPFLRIPGFVTEC